MPAATQPKPISCVDAPLDAIDAEILVIPWFDNEGIGRFDRLDQATGGEISRALASKEFSGKPFDMFLAPIVDRHWKARRLALIGAGKQSSYELSIARKLAAAAGYAVRQRRIASLAF